MKVSQFNYLLYDVLFTLIAPGFDQLEIYTIPALHSLQYFTTAATHTKT